MTKIFQGGTQWWVWPQDQTLMWTSVALMAWLPSYVRLVLDIVALLRGELVLVLMLIMIWLSISWSNWNEKICLKLALPSILKCKGVNVNCSSSLTGYTPLIWASDRGHVEVMLCLCLFLSLSVNYIWLWLELRWSRSYWSTQRRRWTRQTRMGRAFSRKEIRGCS